MDDVKYNFRLTFEPGISQESFDVAKSNLDKGYETFDTQARITVNLINEIEIDK